MLQAPPTQSRSGGTRLEPGARKDNENNDNRNVNNEILLAIKNSLEKKKKRGGGWGWGVERWKRFSICGRPDVTVCGWRDVKLPELTWNRETSAAAVLGRH